MIRLRKRGVCVYFGGRFAVADEFLETEEMAVDTLGVGGPGGVLEVAGDGAAEEGSAMCVLGNISANTS